MSGAHPSPREGPPATAVATPLATPLAMARARDTARRHRLVLDALQQLVAAGEAITVSSVARAAGVHRSFIHRHPDLHTAVTAAQHAVHRSTQSHGRQATGPTDASPLSSATVTDASLRADLANQQAHNQRMHRHIGLLERRLSEALGAQVYQSSGIPGPDELDQLHQHVTDLHERVEDLQRQLADRTDELAAARAANRELMSQLNQPR